MRLAIVNLCAAVLFVPSLSGCSRSEIAEPGARDQVSVSESNADEVNEVPSTSEPKPRSPSQKSTDKESPQIVRSVEGAGQATPTKRPSFSRYGGSVNSLSMRTFSVKGGETPVGSKAMIGKPLPAFSLNDIAGNTLTNETLKGKVVLLDFWATWCGPCREAAPVMQQLHEEFGERGLMVIGANTSEFNDGQIIKTPDAARAYAAEHNYTYTFTYGSDDLKAACGATGLPTFLVIDSDGIVVDVFTSYDDDLLDVLRQKIEPLLVKIPTVDNPHDAERTGNAG